MDVIIVVHTEFGFVHAKEVIPDKKATEGVSKGVPNLIKVADKYGARITFAVMPEVVDAFPKDISHEVGLKTYQTVEKVAKKLGGNPFSNIMLLVGRKVSKRD